MKTILTRLFTVIMLMMFSMGVSAVDVELNKEYKGGKVKVKSQEDQPDGSTLVTITVTPDNGYTITHSDKTKGVIVVAVRPTGGQNATRAPQIAGDLDVTGPTETVSYPNSVDYQFTVPSGLNAWVQDIKFQDSGRKDGEGEPDPGYSGKYYIASCNVSNNASRYSDNPANNFYLCPTDEEDWICYVDPDNYTNPASDNDQPFLTTHKYRATGEDATKAVWIIEKAPVSEANPNSEYYYLKHKDSNRYLTYNGPINTTSGSGQNRLRAHMQSTPNNNSLFRITQDASDAPAVNIAAVAAIDNYFYTDKDGTHNCIYINVSSTDNNSLKGTNGKTDGPTGYKNVGATVGIWYDPGHSSEWYLEDVVNRPTITLSGNQVTITADAGTTLRYTTDNAAPTGTTAITVSDNTVTFSIPANAQAIKAVAVNSDGDVSGVATLKLPAYTYNIVDTEGYIAIKYTVNQLEGSSLTIPEAIRSPYLDGETVTFYSTLSAEGSRANLSDPITSTPEGGGDIYVSYTTGDLENKPLRLNGASSFKMRVNGEYFWDNRSALRHSVSDGDEANTYLWRVAGNDPYRVQVQNLNSTSDYFKWSTTPSASLELGPTASNSNFIIFGGSAAAPEGFNYQVELMAATGEDISSDPYYNVGLDNNVYLLASDTYGHGNAAIQVQLKKVERNVTFHIIDMSGHIVVEQTGPFDALDVPAQWKSPLVETYYFYALENFKVTNGVYTLRPTHTTIDDFNSAPADIYVTYDPSDDYDLDGSENRATDGKKYLLKFADGTKFNQEDGDAFEASAKAGLYPYINGEGGLFVYGQDKLNATEGKVGSTRTRWAWYLEGGDPYRLRISSLQTKTDGEEESHHSYLRTYKPKGYTEVVTGVISDNSSVYDGSDDAHAVRHKPTDYMILNNSTGTHFKLVTSDVVDDYNDETVDVRHTVTSFENYWKTNPTAATVIHDYYENDGDDQTSFAVGNIPTEEQITAALTTGEGAIGWHTYDVWANGSTWTSSSKSFGYGPHWFKTIGVGTETETEGVYNGDFDLVEYNLDGALILLDQHGWEVMRKPITNLSTKKAAYAAKLRKYDSPMVKKYHFWTNFKKEDGYHKYKPIRGESLSKDAQHKGVGTSLTDYPEVLSGGTLADIYVTYEVMDTYRSRYTGAATEAGTNASDSKYLIRQGKKYAQTTDGSTITLVDEATVDLTDPSSIGDELFWYVKPNFYIDTEMGYQYSGSNGEKTQAETESYYHTNRDNTYYDYAPDGYDSTVHDTTNGQNGFDPYNLQIESAKEEFSGKLFTTNAVSTALDGSEDGKGGLVSTYTDPTQKTVTLQSYNPPYPNAATDYHDSQELYVTNSTFMAVSDDNGNIRLMPRFDHRNVVTATSSTPSTILDEQQAAASYGDEDGTQTTLFVLSSTPSSSGDQITVSSSDEITDMNGNYLLDADGFDVTKVIGTKAKPFKGTIDGQLVTIDGMSRPLVAYADGATIKNVIVKTVSINAGNADDNAGAICCEAKGATRIYNCGILPTTTKRDKEGTITGFEGSHVTVTGSGNVGSIVGLLDGESRVINCFSYANVSGGTNAAGIVGNNAVATTANSSDTDHYLKTMVMNCMFYGNITGASTMKPVYGGQIISNAGATGINNYNYYRNGEDVKFDDDYSGFGDYYCTLPADEEYLTRFEYYRSILNSNKRLCTWWINGTTGTAPTDADVEEVGIAKWVLDQEIAPYPILKKWGKYPSVINQDKDYVWNPKTEQKVSRESAEPYQGKKLGTISVTVNAGAKHAGDGDTSKELTSVIVMDMDTLNHDYCYAKIQLPYYNEVFGDPSVELPDPSADDYTSKWNNRYGGNYKDYVVTGWKIISVTGGEAGSFKGYAVTSVPAATSSVSAGTVTPDEISATAWEDGFNFADRKCTNKDLYEKSGRVFAQGGYYYVPEGVTDITIEAYWGEAVYLHNKDHSLDRVNVASGGQGNGADFGTSFSPAGTLPTKFQNKDVQTTLQDAISALTFVGTDYTVYDQAIVLVGNVQVKNRSAAVGDNNTSKRRPFTIMSIDEDMDNEPDYCLEFQFRNGVDRPGIHPVRFDFLPVPELGLAIRTNTLGYTIGIFIPQGHFEITETSFMHTTQFEYDHDINRVESPIILNGGHFEQIVVRAGPKNKVNYFLLGGHFRMKRFTPGYHVNNNNPISGGNVRHCVVNAIGGDYPEFYLSGIYRPDWTVNADNPHCYINGGRFGIVAGAGYEQVDGDVTFKIDHSIISEFYGGGINAAKPVTGTIDVTINNSLVDKYCGGPKVGQMTEVSSGVLKTVTTNATGTTFGVFYGGGNGGTSYYRESKFDNTGSFPTSSSNWWGFTAFNPLNQTTSNAAYKNTINENWGYHAEYEFEVFNSSNGLKSGEDVLRCYYLWAQFGTTITGGVTSTLTDCTITGDFFGGGNLANVTGNVTSILKGNTHVNGSVFGGGYSASIPSFPVHDKNTVSIPTHDAAGNVDEQGSLDYYQDGGKDRMYTWCYKNADDKVFPEGVVIPPGTSTTTKQKSVFRYPDTDDGKWYVLTTEPLEGLGAVSGNAKITLDGNCVVEGSVYGGGDASAVTKKEGVGGNTTVILQGNTQVYGNVFGGGNEGLVEGSATVIIRPEEPTEDSDSGEGSGGGQGT
ncbi:MAG: hypothetical protein IJ886_09095 [Prevotella sp.]|nr:hypothetical protein [Prevotella sp.]